MRLVRNSFIAYLLRYCYVVLSCAFLYKFLKTAVATMRRFHVTFVVCSSFDQLLKKLNAYFNSALIIKSVNRLYLEYEKTVQLEKSYKYDALKTNTVLGIIFHSKSDIIDKDTQT